MNELFEGISTLSEDEKSTLKERIEAEKTEWMKAAQNNEGHINDIRTQAEGKIYASVERWLKKITGLKFEELQSDLKGGERFKEMMTQAIDNIKATKDQTNEDLQRELLAAREETRKLREDEIPEIENRFKAKFDDRQIESQLLEKLAGINVVKERIKPAQVYAKAVLKDRYKLAWNEDSSEISIKTHQDLAPVINDKTVGFDSVLSHILDEGGFIQKSNGTEIGPSPGVQKNIAQSNQKEWSVNARKFAEANGLKL